MKWTEAVASNMPTQGSFYCKDYHGVPHPPSRMWSWLRYAEWLEHSQVHFPPHTVCHRLSIALSLQKAPSVITEELSAPAADHAAARYVCSMANCENNFKIRLR